MEKWWNNFANPMLKRAALLLGLWVFSAWGEVYTVEAGSSSVIDLSGIEQCSDNYMFSFKMTGAGYYAIVVKENDSPIDFYNGWNLTNSDPNWSSTSPSYQAIIINGGAHDDNNISYVRFNPSTKELAALTAAPDCMPPRIINRYPTIGSTAVSSTNSFLNIGFNQDVSKNAGKIHIKKYSDNSTVASIDVNDAAVEFKYKPVLTSFEEEIFFSTHAGAANMQLEPLMVMDGAQSLLVNATANGTVVVKEMSSGVNWSSYDSLVMWVYPLQNNSIELTTLTDEWGWKTHDVGVLNSNAWNRIALYIPDRNRNEAFYGYGIKSDMGSYYVDHVHLVKSSSKDLLVPINTTLDPNTKYYVNFDQGIVKNGGPTSNNALTTKDWHFTTVNPSYFWDTDAAAGIQAGSGTWGSDNYWSIDGTNLTAWPGDGNKAIFAGDHGAAGAYTITVNGTQKPHKIFFSSTGYALTGGELELTGDDPEIQANAAASINSKIKSVYTKTGTGTLSVASHQTGSLVTVSAGTLNISGTSNAANFGPNVNIANNATLTQDSDNLFFGRNTINLNASNATWNLAAYGSQVAWVTGSGKITNNNDALVINLADGVSHEFSGNISGSGGLQLSGENSTTTAGTLHLKSIQSYTGATYIAGGSKAINNAKVNLQLGNGTNLIPSVLHLGDASKSGLTGKLILGDNFGPSHQTFTGLNVHDNSGTFAIVGGNATASNLTLNPSADLVLNGLLGGAGANENQLALTKNGAQVLTLIGTNSYTGPTTVNAGELKVLGSVSNSAVTVASGATLSGTGTTGAVTLQSGAKLQPGDNGAGTLYTGDFDLQNGAELHFDLGTSSDLVEVAGNLTLNGKLVIDAGAGYQAGKYQIFTYTGSLINNLTVDPLPHGFSAKIESSGNQVFLVVYGDHYWDLSAAAGFQTGAGTWGVDNYWSTDGITLRNWPGSPSVAVFAGANDDPSVITINETQTAQGIKFTTGGFKLQSGTLSLAAGGFIYGAGSKTLTIESAINSSGGITLQREGGGDNKYTVEFLNSANTINGPLTLRPKTRLNYATITDGGVTSSLGLGGNGAENIILDSADLRFVGTNDQSSDRLFTLTENGGALLSTSANNAARLHFTNPGAIGLTGVGNRTLELGGNPVVTNILAAVLKDPANGTSALAKSGAAIWALTGDHTYTGGTVISAGALQIGNGGTTGSITGDVLNNASLAFNRSDDLNFTGDISGTGTLTKLGAGTLALNGVNTYAGATTVNAGELKVLGSVSNSAVTVASGATLSGTGTTGAVTLQSGAKLQPGDNGAGTLYTGNFDLQNGAELHFDLGTSSDLVEVTGDLTLSGKIVPNANYQAGVHKIFTYSGNLTNNLTIDPLSHNFQAEIKDSNNAIYLIISGDHYWDLSADEGFQTGAGTWGVDNYWSTGGTDLRYWPGSPSVAIFSGANENPSVITIDETQTAQGIKFTTGGFKLQSGTLSLDAGGFIYGAGSKTLTIESAINSSGGITLQREGGGDNKYTVEFLNSANTINGPLTLRPKTRVNYTTITDGGLVSSLGKGDSGGENIILDGADLCFVGTSDQSSNRLFTLTENGGALLSTSANNAGRLNFTNPGAIGLTGVGARTLELGGNPVLTNILAASLSNPASGTSALAKSGAAIWALTGDHTYTGGTVISAGALQIGNGGTTGSITGDVLNNANLVFNRSNDLSFAGQISGTGTLTKQGAGTLTLSGASTYTGATTISSGTLLLNGSLGNTALSMGSNTTLSGTGTLAGAVTVENNVTIAPGENNAGTLTVGQLTLGATSVLELDIGTASDKIIVTGDLNLRGTIHIVAGAGFKAGLYPIINSSGILTNHSPSLTGLPANYEAKLITTGSNVSLQITKTITIGGSFTAASKVYDGNTTANFATNNLTLVEVDDDHDVSLAPVLEFAQSDVGVGIAVTLANSTSLIGDEAEFYKISFTDAPTSSANITTKVVTITPAAGQQKIYGAADPALNFTNSEWGDNDNIGGNLSRAIGEDAGNYAFSIANLTVGPNYSLALVSDPATFAIIKKDLQVTVNDASINYGAIAPPFTVSYSGWVNGDGAGDLDNTGFTLSSTYTPGDNVGTYPINIALGTATDNNYNFTPLTPGTLTVTAKAITITADDQSKTYGTALNLGSTAFTISPALYQAGDITAVALSSAGAAATANVNTYAITPSAALGPQAANYAITYSNGTLTVGKKDLQVTADDKSITYGDLPAFTVSYSGWVNGDDAGDLDNTGFTLSSTYTPGDNVGTYPINIALGTATDNNYNFTPLTPGTLTITEKAIVVRANNISKVVEAPDPMLTYEVEGSLFGGDNFSGSLTRAAGEAPGTYAIGQGSLQLSPNYIIDFHGATFTIANEMITITINSQSKLYGDNLALGTMGAGWYVSAGNYTAGDITTVELASPGAIGTAAVGTYALTGNNADGPGVSNYAITYINDFLTVDPRPITVTAQNSGKYTGTADPILNYAITSGALYNGDVFAGSLSRDPGEAVNTYAINQGTLDAGDNYDLTFVGADFVIQNKTITIGGSFMVEHKTYDATTNATMDDNQLVLVGVDPTHTVGLSSISAFAQSNVADNILVTLQPSTVLTGADADKYILDLSGAPTTLANIIPAVIEISPAGGQSKVYGNADPIFSYTHSPLVDATPITGALGRAAGDNYGTYPFNLGDLDAGANYTFQMMVAPPTFAILKKDLTVSADDKSVIYGAALPPLTLSYSGFVTGESAANLANTDFALSTTYHTGSSVGTYPIYLALGDASAQNYNLVLQDGILSVGQIDLTISADAQSKVYGQGDPALSYQVSGTVLPGDNFTGALARTAGENVGIYPINQGNLALNSNYNITFQGADLEITAQNLTLSATPQSKLYGDHLSLGTTGWEVSSGNPIAGDITAVTLASLGADSSAPVGNYPLSISLAQGPGIANYTITYTPGTLQVNPRPLTITAADTSKTIGDADPTLTYQITAGRLYNGDALTGNIARTPGESEGPYPINLGDLTLSSNYELSFVPGIFTINPPWLHPIMDYANTKILVYGRNSYQSQNFDAKATYTVVAGHKILVQIPWENPNQDSVQWTSNIPEATVKLTPSRATWTVPFTDSATTVAQFKVSNTRGVGDSIKLQIRTKLASAPTYTIGTVRAYDDAKQTVSMRYFARDTLRLTNAQRLKFSMDFRSSIDQQSVNLNWVQNSPGLNANLWSNHLDLEWHLYEKTNTFSFVVCDEYSLSDTITLTVILQEKPTLTLNPPPLNPYLVFLGGSQQAQGFTLPQAEVVKIRIFDLQGRTWHSQHRILASGSYLFTDFLHTAPQNLYISIESHTFNWTGPLRKQL